MEAVKDRSACPAPVMSSASRLRYPLRSVTKVEKTPVPDALVGSSSRRGRTTSSVSKSVDVLNLSAKEKSLKPPQRLSNPTKRASNPCPMPLSNITPISEIRAKRADSQGKSDTPLSEISSTRRRKFSVLNSVSYWLTQIKLAESASRHSIALGFFKLALESGCEPLQRMREELKSYAQRHNLLSELADVTQNLLQLYEISEDFQKLNISKEGSPLQEGAATTLNEDADRPSVGAGNLKPRSLNTETLSRIAPTKNQKGQRKPSAAKKDISTPKDLVNSVSAKETTGKNIRKKPQKPSKAVAADTQNEKVKSSTKKSTDETVELSLAEPSHEEKENVDVVSTEDGTLEEDIETS